MRRHYYADLYLFGSHSRGTASPHSDYDLVAVSAFFAEQPILRRALDRRKLWREAGGWGIPLDLHCLTPEEFAAETGGFGYLGAAKRSGELVRIKPREAA